MASDYDTDPAAGLTDEEREQYKALLEAIEKAQQSENNPPPLEVSSTAYYGEKLTYNQLVVTKLIFRLLAAGQLRKLLAKFGMEVSRAEAFGMLRAAAFIVSTVTPDRRRLSQKMLDQHNADVARHLLAFSRKLEKHFS